MDVNDVIELYGSVSDHVVLSKGDAVGDEPVPSWWLDTLGADGGRIVADKWLSLFGRDPFPLFAELLRSERCLGTALLRRDYLNDSEWLLGIAFDYVHNPNLEESEREPALYDLRPPVSKTALLPPWWDYYPPELAAFYLQAHASIGCIGDILFDPSDRRQESALFASLPGETHEEWDYYGDAPDPHELLEIAKLNQLEFLFLDIGRLTHNGWVRPWLDCDGGVDPVNVMEAVDHFLIEDYQYQYTRTPGSFGPARPRDTSLNRPADPYWDSYSHELGRYPGWPRRWSPEEE